ncbi:winged helix-turn-helix domain-containing protein [Erwinia tasmaniensis]|uniref:winged helix-turn-helix domain-containing protein n=1 Tax=Erwinia tasmaniensis TaxID=338565 RepID=UPI003A4DC1BC
MANQCDTCYLINEKVIFLPHKNLFISRNNNTQHVIFSTASRCLVLLIVNHGNIVNHQQLYKRGWEEHGKQVTPNTLYQTISELRKQLGKAGLEINIINTIPRQGWVIDQESVVIEEYIPNDFSGQDVDLKPKEKVPSAKLPAWLSLARKLKAFARSLVSAQ